MTKEKDHIQKILWIKAIRIKAITTILIMTMFVLVLQTSTSYAFISEISNLGSLERFPPSQATIVYDHQGRVLGKLFEENRVVIPISQMPLAIQQGIIAVEDERFYKHFGIDLIAIIRAGWVNIWYGTVKEGGSTITQQLAKNAMLTQEQSWTRKIKDAFLAIIIERRYTKKEILEAYLNQIYLGEGAYGVEAASLAYFGKQAKDLTLAECALLAGLPRSPEYYSPYWHPEEAKGRRNLVLSKMAAMGYITEQQMQEAKNTPVKLAGRKTRVAQASYYLDYLANQLVEKFGANKVYRGGLRVYTGMDIDMQQAAEKVIADYNQQGALIALDPKTGYIRAMVGGKNYQESQLNRAITFYRQPGSLMKPFVYAVAIDQGYKVNDIIVDDPTSFGKYSPQNYDKKFRGAITMKKALKLSINVPAVKMLNQVGIDNVANLATNMGLTSLVPDDRNLALALGGLTNGVSLLDMTTAYGVFANQGIKSKPLVYIRVEESDGKVLEEESIEQKSVLKPETAYLVTDMLKAVIEEGTGTAARINRPAAGKTGTTDDYITAWFVGYTPDLVAGLYIGNDNMQSVGITGAHVAELWGDFMKQGAAKIPVSDFPVPPGIITGIRVSADSGRLAAGFTRETETGAFIRGTEPKISDVKPKQSTKQENKDKEEEDKEKEKPRIKLPRIPGFTWPF